MAAGVGLSVLWVLGFGFKVQVPPTMVGGFSQSPPPPPPPPKKKKNEEITTNKDPPPKKKKNRQPHTDKPETPLKKITSRNELRQSTLRLRVSGHRVLGLTE